MSRKALHALKVEPQYGTSYRLIEHRTRKSAHEGHEFYTTGQYQQGSDDWYWPVYCVTCAQSGLFLHGLSVIELLDHNPVAVATLTREETNEMFRVLTVDTKAGTVGQVHYEQTIVWESEPFPVEPLNENNDRPHYLKANAAAEKAKLDAVTKLFSE